MLKFNLQPEEENIRRAIFASWSDSVKRERSSSGAGRVRHYNAKTKPTDWDVRDEAAYERRHYWDAEKFMPNDKLINVIGGPLPARNKRSKRWQR
jgi:hypothetical protein